MSTPSHKVVVTVYNCKNSDQAVDYIHHKLNGCNPIDPNTGEIEITYAVESLQDYETHRKIRQKVRQRKLSQPAVRGREGQVS